MAGQLLSTIAYPPLVLVLTHSPARVSPDVDNTDNNSRAPAAEHRCYGQRVNIDLELVALAASGRLRQDGRRAVLAARPAALAVPSPRTAVLTGRLASPASRASRPAVSGGPPRPDRSARAGAPLRSPGEPLRPRSA